MYKRKKSIKEYTRKPSVVLFDFPECRNFGGDYVKNISDYNIARTLID